MRHAGDVTMFKQCWENTAQMMIEPIGIIRSCFTEKFGIPRQPGLVTKARATLHLYPPYARQEMVKELDQFSHLWVQFLFHDAVADGWKPTVRPPGLGGQKRVGVFASRSPHRPNHLGLSAVRLIDISSQSNTLLIEVGGGDFLDNTPLIDIKPYIPYSDCLETARGGYSGGANSPVEVNFSPEAAQFCMRYAEATGRDLSGLITETLAQDPRPASQRAREKSFGFMLWDINIRWLARGNVFTVLDCSEAQDPL